MISKLSPEIVWKHFYELTQIPRPSGHEDEVIAYLVEFAGDNGLEHLVDEAGNLIIRKPASEGRENAPTVILQTHVDMVPQKNSEKVHDFEKDPIETLIDGEWVKANETTLGADNGMGMAASLAVLESDEITHGPVEVLFTISEETGMDGAFGLKPDVLKGSILLNLDSEGEGELYIGCAGGVDVNIAASYEEISTEDSQALKIIVSGLKGGHSGMDINLGRANANLVLVDLIRSLSSEISIGLSSLSGGNLRNAIPREAEAVITIPADNKPAFDEFYKKFTNQIKDSYANADGGMQFEIVGLNEEVSVVEPAAQERILETLTVCPNGVLSMSEQMPGIVQTSNNIAIVRLGKGELEVKMLLRSASDAEKDEYGERIKELFTTLNAKATLSGAYPGWLPNNQSLILQKAQTAYKRLFDMDPKIMVVHAGLECGIIGGAYPGLDMLSFGPTIKFPHSPDEKVHIGSVDRFWAFLKEVLEVV